MRIQVNRNRNGEPLTNDQLQKFAPSAFAGQAYDAMSDRYSFIPTIEIIEGMRDAGFVPVAARQSRSRTAGKGYFTKHQIRFRDLSANLTQVGDTAVEVVIVNSHDGTSCLEEMLGAFRLACLNGMMVSEGLAESIKVRHTGNIIERVVEYTHNLIQMAPRVINAIQNWKQIQLSSEEQIILAEGALALRWPDAAPVGPERLLTVNRNADVNNDLWTVFNRIQENSVNGGIKYIGHNQAGEQRRNRTRQVTGIDQSTKLNRELWTLAEKMAELWTIVRIWHASSSLK